MSALASVVTSEDVSNAEVRSANPAIQISDLDVRFGQIQAVSNVSLSVNPGEFVSIVGPSGCGKTTILNMVAGLLCEPLNRISVLGQRPTLGNPDVAYMLARDCLFPWRTALENTAFGLEVRGVTVRERYDRATQLLEEVGLKGFENHYPKALSHGMRQRVALARTFCLDSQIMLMDEPFGALDAQTKLQLEDLLLSLWGRHKRTVLFITHDLSEAVSMSDRVVVMAARPGRILADMPIPLSRPRSVKALQHDPEYLELYANLWRYLEAAFDART